MPETSQKGQSDADPTDDSEASEVGVRASESADRELLQRACKGESATWDTLHGLFNQRFHVLAVRLLLKHGPSLGVGTSRAFVEDLVQAVWQHILSRCQEIEKLFDPAKGNLEGYIMTVAHHQIISQLRSNSRRPWSADGDLAKVPESTERQASPENRAADRQVLARLRDCMQRELGARDVELLVRILVEDEDIRAVAAQQGTSRNNLDQRISRARRRLRECMQELELGRNPPRK